MITLQDAVPCSICGCKPILSVGERSGRLRCLNYKSKEIQHGNLHTDTNGITMGFMHWCYLFWNEKQREKWYIFVSLFLCFRQL